MSEPESNGTTAIPTSECVNSPQGSSRLTRRRFVGASAAALSLSAAGSRLGSFHPGASAQDLPATAAAEHHRSNRPLAPARSRGVAAVAFRPAYGGRESASALLRHTGGRRRIANGAAIGSNGVFNPAGFRQDFQIMVSYLDPLVWIDEVAMEPHPWLAETWNFTRDSLALTIQLREDVALARRLALHR